MLLAEDGGFLLGLGEQTGGLLLGLGYGTTARTGQQPSIDSNSYNKRYHRDDC